jgi:hypothetical protein
MSTDTTPADSAGGAGAAEPLRRRLERFGDPRKTSGWARGKADYLSQLGLTAADVPELLSITRQWAEPFDWPEDETDFSGYAPVHAWRCLAQLGAAETVGPLLEMIEPLEELDDDWYPDELPHVFALIGPASFTPLREYLADERHGMYPRVCAATGLMELARRHGQLRGDAVKALCDVLSKFEHNDGVFNGYLIADLLDLKATEAAELIERAHAADRVDLTMCGNWEAVRQDLGVEGLGLVPPRLATKKVHLLSPETEAGLKVLRESLGIEAGDPEDLDDPWDGGPVSQPAPAKKAGRNDPCPCGSGKKYKKCCLR